MVSELHVAATIMRPRPWLRPKVARDQHEEHRQASWLELFFDP